MTQDNSDRSTSFWQGHAYASERINNMLFINVPAEHLETCLAIIRDKGFPYILMADAQAGKVLAEQSLDEFCSGIIEGVRKCLETRDV